MKHAASLLILISVNYIDGHLWSTGTKHEKGHPTEPPKACWKKPFVGVCHPLKEAWYYEPKDNTCRMLTAGSCAGGNNLFPTLRRCNKECIPLTPKNSGVCLQRPIIGSCGPLLVSWFYDESNKFCRMFNHTICGGGGNAFLTELKCLSTCRPTKKPKAVCSLTPKPGRCFLGKRRWYFNEKIIDVNSFLRNAAEVMTTLSPHKRSAWKDVPI
uniref:Putative bovine pancreatic trypsin inhibitor n=1 Tax=Rhipicephalus microplus TaxID=6941 RepID=A0A6G5A700_RHIMP